MLKRRVSAPRASCVLDSPLCQVYHAFTENNRLVQFRVGVDGRLILDNTIKSIYVQTGKLNRAGRGLVTAGRLVPQRAAKRMRKAITGDPNKRIRDHMKEVPQVQKKTPQ